jgi:hypothetical protein
MLARTAILLLPLLSLLAQAAPRKSLVPREPAYLCTCAEGSPPGLREVIKDKWWKTFTNVCCDENYGAYWEHGSLRDFWPHGECSIIGDFVPGFDGCCGRLGGGKPNCWIPKIVDGGLQPG